MTPVSGATTAGRVYLDIQRLAKSSRRPTDELIRTYVLECFLWRVAHSEYRDRLVLKGGLLLAALGERRPTADVDLLARDMSNDLEAVAEMVRAVLAVENDDGVFFEVDSLRIGTIRDDELYPGARVVVPAMIDRARAVLRVDVNVGDPVTPGPVVVDYQGILHESFRIVGYPVQTVLAEKIVTMMDRGNLTTRERDFADVWMLMSLISIEAVELARAIDATIAHRGSTRRSLRIALADLGEHRQNSWRAFVASARLQDSVPDSYTSTIDDVIAFADPILEALVSNAAWDPSESQWR